MDKGESPDSVDWWKCILIHLPLRRCHIRVSSDWWVWGRPCLKRVYFTTMWLRWCWKNLLVYKLSHSNIGNKGSIVSQKVNMRIYNVHIWIVADAFDLRKLSKNSIDINHNSFTLTYCCQSKTCEIPILQLNFQVLQVQKLSS